MVSTQKTFFATNSAFPCILGKAPFPPPGCVSPVLHRSSVNRSAVKTIQTPSVAKVISKHAEIQSRKLLQGLAFKGNTPNSVSDLIALGAERNADAITDGKVDEAAAFENDVAYYKVLLEAREKHREALRIKLHAMRTALAKKSTMYRKRSTTRRLGKPAATACHAESNSESVDNQRKLASISAWPTPCASPVSTDVESDASSVLDDDDVSVEKPVIYAV